MYRFDDLGIDWDTLRGELDESVFIRLHPERLPWVLDQVMQWRGVIAPGFRALVSVGLPTDGGVRALPVLDVFAGSSPELAGFGEHGPETRFHAFPFDDEGVMSIGLVFAEGEPDERVETIALVHYSILLAAGPADYAPPVE